MRKLVVGVVLALITASSALAAPPAPSASLSVTAIVAPCAEAFTADRGCLYFASEPDRPSGGGGRHIVLVRIFATWTPGIAEEGQSEIDGHGAARYDFRFGFMNGTVSYSDSFVAWVATAADPLTPISAVVSGPLPQP